MNAALIVAALIVAAGRGRRLGGPLPKQYRKLGGVPVLCRTLGVFLAHPAITRLRVVIHPDDRELYDAATAGLELPPPVAGGETRQESVRRGLEALAADAPDRVLIHDAVRPFVEPATISAVLATLDRYPAAIAALPVADTLKRCEDGVIRETIARTNIWRAQTPQGFRFADILAAHRREAGQDLTDDALLAERAGLPVAVVPGSEDNFKITTAADLARAEAMLRVRNTPI